MFALRLFASTFALACACACTGLTAASQGTPAPRAEAQALKEASGYLPLRSPAAAHIADLALIYQGGVHRPSWTAEELEPYVRYEDSATGSVRWLFDGFLFIEFKDGRGQEFAHGYRQKAARKEDWLWLLDRNFEKGRAIDALDEALERTQHRIAPPARKRKVVLTLPEPIFGQRDWGELDGRALDFNKAEDRVAACRWHLDTALAQWNRLAPRHLELAGFYWVAETSSRATEILPRIAERIRALGKRFYWIPYWGAAGAADWRRHGFDAAYQQPNHFFKAEIPDSRLDKCCEAARARGMGLEFECDGRAIKSAEVFRPRLEAYLRVFEAHGVKSEAAMAYYEGGGALLQMARSEDPAVQALYLRLARWVADRQERAP